MGISGRVLYLVDDPGMMRAQLAGDEIPAARARALLRDEISTDEIIPARHCMDIGPALASHCYEGLRCGAENPVAEGAVVAGGFAVSVAGARRGKGSSREQAPYAELRAGIRLVLARSFERIYRQNCHNLGIATSVNLALLDKLEGGEEISFGDLSDELDPVSREILLAGGLFHHFHDGSSGPLHDGSSGTGGLPGTAPRPAAVTPATLAKKILDRHAVGDSDSPEPGSMRFFRCDLRYSHEYVTPMAEALIREEAPGREFVDPETIILFEDHLSAIARSPGVTQETIIRADGLAREQARFALDHRLRLHGRAGDWSEGICHALVVERYAEPGQLIVGSDSHTCHVGALGCVAVGVGASDIAYAWITGHAQLPEPRHLLVRVEGALRPGVTEKDLMLHLLAHPAVRQGRAIGAIVEFAGGAVSALDVDGRCTLTNMAAEMGAISGIVAPDERTVEYLVSRRGMPERQARAACAGLTSDEGARHDLVIEIRAEDVDAMIAFPGDPGNAVPIARLPAPIAITQAYGGSCTAAKRRDMDMYATVLRQAVEQGRRVPGDVRFFIQAGSRSVLEYCAEMGYLDLFDRAGATFLGPSCGACINAGPGASASASEVTVSAQNRNFPGRSGPGSLYLASPLTVAASAVAGHIAEFAIDMSPVISLDD